ncbi:MAG: enoyl-CoA hydratase/isomerase family protein [Pirellula sp.]
MIKTRKQVPSGTIILDHPASRNALSREMVGNLLEAFSDFHREPLVRAVILTGSGPVFCSGVDLKQWNEIAKENEPLEQWQDVASELQELIEVMLRFPKPIIACVDGAVFGAGLAIVLACDLVVSSPRSSFQLPAPKHGLISGLVAPLMAFRCGGGVAARLLLGAEVFDTTEAHRVGLVHHVVSSELTWAKSHDQATKIAEGAAESVQMSKRLLNEMIGESLLMHLASGAAAMATACSTTAATEGLSAFAEKRPRKHL